MPGEEIATKGYVRSLIRKLPKGRGTVVYSTVNEEDIGPHKIDHQSGGYDYLFTISDDPPSGGADGDLWFEY